MSITTPTIPAGHNTMARWLGLDGEYTIHAVIDMIEEHYPDGVAGFYRDYDNYRGA